MSDQLSDSLAKAPLSRRHVFVGAGTAGALAAVAAVLPKSQPAAVVESVAEVLTPQPTGYQLTEHVQRYYQTARV